MSGSGPGQPARRLVLVLAGLTAIRLVVAATAGLAEDESYYRLWSFGLAGGYYDHAPMVAFLIRAGRAIAGDDPLGIRLFGPIATFLGSLLLWRTVALAEGRAVADRATLFLNATLLIGAGSVIITPDTPSVLFWGATVWALAELSRSRDPRWWFAVGIAAGLGLASKYSVLFLGLGIVVWLVSSSEARRWFSDWRLWAGGAIALALFSPVVAWNASHEWISFAKQFGRTVPHGFRPEKFAEFLGVQWLLIGLPLAPLVVAGIGRGLGAMRDGDALRGLPIATSLPFVLYLGFHSFHGGIEGNWPAPLYGAAAWLAATASFDAVAWRQRLARWVMPFGFGLTGLVYLHATLPILVLPPERDPTAQMRGWDAFAVEVAKRRDAVGAGWIAVPNFGMTGQFAYRLGSGAVRQIGEPRRWANLPPLDPAPTERPALWVVRTARDRTATMLAGRFRSIEPLGTIERRSGGRVVDTYALYRLDGAIGDPTD